MTTDSIPNQPTCTCGRALEGDKILVCSGCHRNPAVCYCHGVMETATGPLCLCGNATRELQNKMQICAGCGAPPAACKCRKRMYAGQPSTGGIFAGYSATPIFNDRGTNTTGSRERAKADAREDRKVER